MWNEIVDTISKGVDSYVDIKTLKANIENQKAYRDYMKAYTDRLRQTGRAITSGLSDYYPYIIGGAVVIGVIVFAKRK